MNIPVASPERLRELRRLHLAGKLGEYCGDVLRTEIEDSAKWMMFYKIVGGFPEYSQLNRRVRTRRLSFDLTNQDWTYGKIRSLMKR